MPGKSAAAQTEIQIDGFVDWRTQGNNNHGRKREHGDHQHHQLLLQFFRLSPLATLRRFRFVLQT